MKKGICLWVIICIGLWAAGCTGLRQDAKETVLTYTFEEPGRYRYAYHQLSEREQKWYEQMNEALGRMLEKQELSPQGLIPGEEQKTFDKIFQCVMDDHPEYFYADGYTCSFLCRQNQTVKVEFTANYSMDIREAEEKEKQIAKQADLWLSGLSENADEYERVKYVYETIIRNTEYDRQAPDNQNIYSVFLRKRSVCQGYAKAAQYLLNRLGIESMLVTGTVTGGESHAWNLVKRDGDDYYLDVTWGDASFRRKEADLAKAENDFFYQKSVSYEYLGLTSEEFGKTHFPESVVPLPECTAVADNYYVREGAYFTEFKEGELKEQCKRALSGEKKEFSFKCSSLEVFEQIRSCLLKDQTIFDWLSEIPKETDHMAYSIEEDLLTMRIWV